MSPRQSFIVLTLVTAVAGCVDKFARNPMAGEDQLTAALVAGDDLHVRQITDQILAGARSLNLGMLTDERTVGPGVILRATADNKQR